jgi:hypothetical protein
VDLNDPQVSRWFAVIDHIESAMYLLNKNDGVWSSLSQAKSSAERNLGSILLNRARRAAPAPEEADRV